MSDSTGSTTANPLAGLLTGGTSTDTGAWGTLSAHEKAVAWGGINDVFLQILGRQATMAEAQKYYGEGLSNYAIGQQLMESKEFVGTPAFNQLKRGYEYELAQFVGGGFKLKNKQIQSFASNNYTTTDIQAWVYSHPHVYVQSNDYKTRVAQMKDVYQSVFGIDPYASGNTGTHKVDVEVGNHTNKGRTPGAPPPPGSGIKYNPQTGEWYKVEQQADDPLLAHIHQAALNFQTTDQYRAYLMNTPAYQQQARAKVNTATGADSGLTLDSRGRPIQQGLSGIGHQQAADVAQ